MGEMLHCFYISLVLTHTLTHTGSPSIWAPQAVIQCQERPSSQEQLFVCLSSSLLSIPSSYSSLESLLCSRAHTHTQKSRMLHLFSHYRLAALFSGSSTWCSVSLSSLLVSPLWTHKDVGPKFFTESIITVARAAETSNWAGSYDYLPIRPLRVGASIWLTSIKIWTFFKLWCNSRVASCEDTHHMSSSVVFQGSSRMHNWIDLHGWT